MPARRSYAQRSGWGRHRVRGGCHTRSHTLRPTLHADLSRREPWDARFLPAQERREQGRPQGTPLHQTASHAPRRFTLTRRACAAPSPLKGEGSPERMLRAKARAPLSRTLGSRLRGNDGGCAPRPVHPHPPRLRGALSPQGRGGHAGMVARGGVVAVAVCLNAVAACLNIGTLPDRRLVRCGGCGDAPHRPPFVQERA